MRRTALILALWCMSCLAYFARAEIQLNNSSTLSSLEQLDPVNNGGKKYDNSLMQPKPTQYAWVSDGNQKKLIQYTEVVGKPVHGDVPSLTVEKEKTDSDKPKVSKTLMIGGSALIGALPGFFSGGILTALGGGVIAGAAAYMASKGDYGAAAGIMIGGVVGTALFPPFGGLIGAVVGGFVGHWIGSLFTHKAKS